MAKFHWKWYAATLVHLYMHAHESMPRSQTSSKSFPKWCFPLVAAEYPDVKVHSFQLFLPMWYRSNYYFKTSSKDMVSQTHFWHRSTFTCYASEMCMTASLLHGSLVADQGAEGYSALWSSFSPVALYASFMDVRRLKETTRCTQCSSNTTGRPCWVTL